MGMSRDRNGFLLDLIKNDLSRVGKLDHDMRLLVALMDSVHHLLLSPAQPVALIVRVCLVGVFFQ